MLPAVPPPRTTRTGRALRASRVARVALLGLVVAGLAACQPIVVPPIGSTVPPPPLTQPPVVVTGAGTFIGDGYQHGPTGTPTQNLIRDGGLPTTLPDGYTFQVYGDTVSVPEVSPFYFLTNSAALSPPGSPQSTLEATRNNRPLTLLPWTSAEEAVKVNGVRYFGIWPSGSTWVPNGVAGGGRVLITYSRVWVDMSTNPITFQSRGQGVAEYRYTTAQNAIDNGIVATRLNDDLFPNDNDVEMGTPVYADGFVYFYGCSQREIRCYSARTTPDAVTTPAVWKWFDGTGYSATRATRQQLGFGEFSSPHVQWVAGYKAFAMVNSRGGNQAYVRWAASASGPWTEPQLITLPGCGTTMYAGGCYLLSIRPESTPTSLTMTYASYGSSRLRIASIPVRLAT